VKARRSGWWIAAGVFFLLSVALTSVALWWRG